MQKFFTMLANKPRLTSFPYQVSCVAQWTMYEVEPAKVKPWNNKLSFAIRTKADFGNSIQLVNGSARKLTFPHVLIKRPGNSYQSINVGGGCSLTLDYPSGQCQSMMTALGLAADEHFLTFELNSGLEALIRKVVELAQVSITRGSCDRLDVAAYRLLTELVVQGRYSSAVNTDRNVFMKLSSYLQAHCREDIDFDRLAVRFGMSRSTLFRKWNRLFQVSPARYIQELRLQEARRLLVETGERVCEVARMVGFDNVPYFIQAFRRYFGITPTAFRKNENFIPGIGMDIRRKSTPDASSGPEGQDRKQ